MAGAESSPAAALLVGANPVAGAFAAGKVESGAAARLNARACSSARYSSNRESSDFHERLLKVGNMPPALMREGLMQTYKA
jgi:hypothetical protein